MNVLPFARPNTAYHRTLRRSFEKSQESILVSVHSNEKGYSKALGDTYSFPKIVL